MRAHGMYSWGNPWFRWSLVSLIVMTVLSMLVGFLLLPSMHADFTAQGLWASICRAAGVPGNWGETSAGQKAAARSTDVVLERTMARSGAVVGPGSAEAASTPDALDDDHLYDRAVSLVRADQKASVSYLQRKLSIGYNRAAGIIERMEHDGLVSQPSAAGKREVLTTTEAEPPTSPVTDRP